MKPRLILVGGGTGFIGGALTQMLKWHGFKPKVVTRLPDEEARNSQISWKELVRQGLPRDCYAVINLCGATIGDPWARWTPRYRDVVWDSRVKTTEAFRSLILKAEHKPKVFISSSAVGKNTLIPGLLCFLRS